MKTLHSMFKTNSDSAPLIARLTLGLIMLPHGAQKALGWFGGYGYEGTMGYFTGALGIPALVAFLVIAAEFAGAIGLITGFLTRVSAFGIAAVMAGAIVMAHKGNGFFMNWSGQQAGEGYEFHLLAIGLALIPLIFGAGRASLDSLVAKRLAKE